MYQYLIVGLITLLCLALAWLMYYKITDPVGFVILRLKFNWWRATFWDITLYKLAKYLDKLIYGT
jgi:hypothetical protein